jgi:acyl-coenzyme A thioesterase PaaI-like protein
MDKLNALVQKARHSKFYLWVLNFMLLRMVPFNNPHKLKIQTIADDGITMFAANTKNNRNHIKGIHACLLATLCEYVTGLTLLTHLSPKEYRIILKNIHMTYHFQAKTDVFVKFTISSEEKQNILSSLQKEEAIFKEYAVDVYDVNKNHICTGLINWQIKAWKNVKTQLN